MKHLGIYVALMLSTASALFGMEQERLESFSITEALEQEGDIVAILQDIATAVEDDMHKYSEEKIEPLYLKDKDSQGFRKENYRRMKVAACILRAHPSFIPAPLSSSIIELQKEAAEFLIGCKLAFSVGATKAIHEFHDLRHVHKKNKKREAKMENLKAISSSLSHQVSERLYHDEKLQLKKESVQYKKKKCEQSQQSSKHSSISNEDVVEILKAIKEGNDARIVLDTLQLKNNEERLQVEQELLKAQKKSNDIEKSHASAAEAQARALQDIKETQDTLLNIAKNRLYNADYQTQALQTIASEHQKQTALNEAQAASLDMMANTIAAELPEVSNGLLKLKLAMEKNLAYKQEVYGKKLDFEKAQQKWQQEMKDYKSGGQFGSLLYRSASFLLNVACSMSYLNRK